MHATLLKYIDQVARVGSIRKAAAVLNVASSAVNRQILKLEAEVGTKIFARVGNGVQPTPAGEKIISHARKTLAEWQDVRRGLSSLSDDVHGEVRIVSIPSLMVRILPRAIAATTSLHPNISYFAIDTGPREQTEEMRAGRPDVAVQFIDQRHRDYVIAARLKLHLGAVMRNDHVLADHESLTLTDCASFPVVMLDQPWLLSMLAEAEFSHTGALFRPIVTSNSLQLTKETIRSGLGIGFFTPVGFFDELESGEFVHVALKEPELLISEIGILVHRERQHSPAVKALVSQLIVEFSKMEEEVKRLSSN